MKVGGYRYDAIYAANCLVNRFIDKTNAHFGSFRMIMNRRFQCIDSNNPPSQNLHYIENCIISVYFWCKLNIRTFTAWSEEIETVVNTTKIGIGIANNRQMYYLKYVVTVIFLIAIQLIEYYGN